MSYKVEFLNGKDTAVHVMRAKARSPTAAFFLVCGHDWPPDALTACVVDKDGRLRLSVSKPQARPRGRNWWALARGA